MSCRDARFVGSDAEEWRGDRVQSSRCRGCVLLSRVSLHGGTVFCQLLLWMGPGTDVGRNSCRLLLLFRESDRCYLLPAEIEPADLAGRRGVRHLSVAPAVA